MAALALTAALTLVPGPRVVDGAARPTVTWPQRPAAYLEEQPPLPPPLAHQTSAGMGGGCSSGYVHDLIVSYDWNDAEALMIAGRESGCDPTQKNPISSASGVFQLTAFWWDGENAYGWVFDPFDAAANVAHAYLMWSADGGSFCPGQWCV